jgi:hypothetical protein
MPSRFHSSLPNSLTAASFQLRLKRDSRVRMWVRHLRKANLVRRSSACACPHAGVASRALGENDEATRQDHRRR